ncbi:DNA binding domain, excisionase family, partial [Dysosmobacter welbionis]
FLKVRTADRSRVGQDVPDVADAGEVHHQPFKTQAEARVLAGAVAPQVAVPPVVLGVHAQLPDAAFQDFQ